MRWPRSGPWGQDRGGSQSRGRDFAIIAPPQWGQHLQKVETNHPLPRCSSPAWGFLSALLHNTRGKLRHEAARHLLRGNLCYSGCQIFFAWLTPVQSWIAFYRSSRSLAFFFFPFPEIFSFVLILIYASGPEFTHTSLSSPPLPTPLLPSLSFHPPVSLLITQTDLKLAFEGQPQANGVDLVWIILDLIQEWVGGSLELCKGSLMIWLLSDSAITQVV